MEYGCIAGTGRAVIVYVIFGIKFVGRPEGAFSLSAVSYSPVSLYRGRILDVYTYNTRLPLLNSDRTYPVSADALAPHDARS